MKKFIIVLVLVASFFNILREDVLAQATGSTPTKTVAPNYTIDPTVIKTIAPLIENMSDEQIRALANQYNVSPSLTPATIKGLAKASSSMEPDAMEVLIKRIPSMDPKASEALAKQISAMDEKELEAFSEEIASMSPDELDDLFESIGSGNSLKTNSLAKGSKVKIEFGNPLKYDTVEGLLGNAMKVIQGIVGILAVFMIVVGGVMYIISGTTGQTEAAKSIIKWALVGLAITLAAPSFIQEIYEILGETEPEVTVGKKSIYEILLSATTAVLNFIGALSVLMIVVGGVMWIVNQSDTAKKIVNAAIIGLVIALTSLVVVNAIVMIFK